jgi:predicted  nucleic acid-binding Zn-ribbon protein
MAREVKKAEHKIEMLNVTNKNLNENVSTLKGEQYELNKTIKTREETIIELENQLAMSKDSINVIKKLQM